MDFPLMSLWRPFDFFSFHALLEDNDHSSSYHYVDLSVLRFKQVYDRLRHFFSLLPLDLDLKLDIFDIYYSSPSSDQSELLHQDWPSLFKLPQGCEVVDVKHKQQFE